MTNGVVSGGWEYVVAAYSITVGALVLYAVWLIAKLRGEGGGRA